MIWPIFLQQALQINQFKCLSCQNTETKCVILKLCLIFSSPLTLLLLVSDLSDGCSDHLPLLVLAGGAELHINTHTHTTSQYAENKHAV